jgi:purine-nucleoside phosphorylase
VLVGDPARALLLAQELLEQPRMSNHARGLWGYSGRTAAGSGLTIQSTGIGAPSAAAVLADLAELGVERAVRVGTCRALDPAIHRGELLISARAFACDGVSRAHGREGEFVPPDAGLLAALRDAAAGSARAVATASFDLPRHTLGPDHSYAAADLQTAALFTVGAELGVALAALLIVAESAAGERLEDEPLAETAVHAGRAAAAALSG